jgi:hypothetical protein
MAAGYSSPHDSQTGVCFFLFLRLTAFQLLNHFQAGLSRVMPSAVSVCMTFAVRRARGIHAPNYTPAGQPEWKSQSPPTNFTKGSGVFDLT